MSSIHSIKDKSLSIINDSIAIASKYDFTKTKELLENKKNVVSNFKVNAPLIGLFSSGKSSLLNKYFGIEYLPEAITPLTAVACELYYSNDNYLEVVDNKGNISKKDVDYLSKLTSDSCAYVKMYLNNEKLSKFSDITIVDMPGLDSGYEQHNKAIRNYLNDASYFIVVVDAEQGTPKDSLLSFLKELDLYKLNFAVIITKADLKIAQDIEKIKEYTLNVISDNIGEEVFVGAVSAINNELSDFDKVITNVQVDSIVKRFIRNNIVYLIENELKTELERKIKYSTLDTKEINDNINKVKNDKKNIDKIINNEITNVKNKVNGEVVNNIVSDISNVLSSNVDMLVSKVKENSSSLSNAINQLVRPVIVSSSDKHLTKALGDIYSRLQLSFDTAIGELNVIAPSAKDLSITHKGIDDASDVLKDLVQSRLLTTVGMTAAGTLATTAAASAAITLSTVAVPIAGALVLAALPLLSGLFKSNIENSQNEEIKSQILGNVIPSVLDQIRNNIEAMVAEQTGNFMEAIKSKFNDDIESIGSQLQSLIEEKINKENEFEAVKKEMEDDLIKINNIISEMNTIL
ncbi:dynamin family protein [Brachyspira pulli]|uniref:dynamin family protein n=1 Tax=Brachyspira pulli TaxID=310721 RepID=UPI003004E334